MQQHSEDPTASTGERASAAWSPRLRVALAVVLLIGSLVCLAYVPRPLDYRIRSPWRQADGVQIARSFYREGMNIFYPRIDWRRTGPGYVEMEFPALPWFGAVLFKIAGYHEQLLRLLSALLGIGSLLLFAALARGILPPIPTIFATAAFALNPLLFHLATAIQPEPLMLFCSLAAVTLCWRWGECPDSVGLMLATAAAIAAATLAKTSAAYLGLVFGYEILRRLGTRAFRTPVVYLAGVVAVLPPLAWYLWAYGFWTVYGNSLGVSSQDHLLTLEMLLPPRFLIGLVKWETLGVFTPFGWLLALAALRWDIRRMERPLVWYLATWAFYLPTARTTAADWAFYYHCNSVAPGCLLMGGGLAAFLGGGVASRWKPWLRRSERWGAPALAAATLATLVALIVAYLQLRDGRDDLRPMYLCSLEFAHHVPEGQPIVVSGVSKFDDYGGAADYNVAMPFTWMDRKGFIYPLEDFGIDTLDRIAREGGRYWMASRTELETDGIRSVVERKYRLLAACQNEYFLYELAPG